MNQFNNPNAALALYDLLSVLLPTWMIGILICVLWIAFLRFLRWALDRWQDGRVMARSQNAIHQARANDAALRVACEHRKR